MMQNIYFYATADRSRALFTIARGPSHAAQKFRQAGLLGARDRTVVPVSKALYEFLKGKREDEIEPVLLEPVAPVDNDLAIPAFLSNDHPHSEADDVRGSGWPFIGGLFIGSICGILFTGVVFSVTRMFGWL